MIDLAQNSVNDLKVSWVRAHKNHCHLDHLPQPKPSSSKDTEEATTNNTCSTTAESILAPILETGHITSENNPGNQVLGWSRTLFGCWSNLIGIEGGDARGYLVISLVRRCPCWAHVGLWHYHNSHRKNSLGVNYFTITFDIIYWFEYNLQ